MNQTGLQCDGGVSTTILKVIRSYSVRTECVALFLEVVEEGLADLRGRPLGLGHGRVGVEPAQRGERSCSYSCCESRPDGKGAGGEMSKRRVGSRVRAGLCEYRCRVELAANNGGCMVKTLETVDGGALRLRVVESSTRMSQALRPPNNTWAGTADSGRAPLLLRPPPPTPHDCHLLPHAPARRPVVFLASIPECLIATAHLIRHRRSLPSVARRTSDWFRRGRKAGGKEEEERLAETMLQAQSPQTLAPGDGPPPSQQRHPKRKAETQDNERLSKRLSLLNIGKLRPSEDIAGSSSR
jgi:hypothetical protein